MTKKTSENAKELPNGWEWKKLGEIVDFQGGSQPPKSEFSHEHKEGYVRLIQIRDYKSDDYTIYVKEKSVRKFCTKTDVMIGRYGPPVFQILRGLEGAYNVALMKAIPKKELVNQDYLFRFLQNDTIQTYINGLSQRSAGQSGVDKNALEKYKVLLPPLKEQERIVQKLDTAFQSLDEAITLQKENIAHTQELKKAVLEECYLELYENFKKVKINEITNSFNGYAFDSKSFNDKSIGNQVVRIGNVMDLSKNPVYINIDDRFNKWLLKEGDIIMSLTGTRGKKDYLFASIIQKPNLYLNQRVACFRINNNALNKYLYYYFWSSLFRDTIFESETGAVNQGNMSLNNILNFQIPLPPLSEQEKIVAYLDTSFAKLNALMVEQEERLAQIMELKKSILQEAFEGKL